MKKTTSKTQEFIYAGFWIRLLALFLDSLVIGILSSSLSFIFFGNMSRGQDFTSFNFMPSALIAFAYQAFFWIKHDGQTIGKKVMGIKVVRQDGLPLDLTTAITRYIGYLISGAVFALGYISAGFNSKKLAWHDRLADTYVIKVGKPNKLVKILLIIFTTLIGLFIIFSILITSVVFKKAIENKDGIYDTFNKMEQFGKNMEKYKGPQDLDILEEEIEKLDPSGKLDIDININGADNTTDDATPSSDIQSI